MKGLGGPSPPSPARWEGSAGHHLPTEPGWCRCRWRRELPGGRAGCRVGGHLASGLTPSGLQGMPGKDGRDGVPGLDGEKVGTSWRSAGEGGLWGFSLQDLSTRCPPKLPQGEAGRSGAPGEKGPDGLPVSECTESPGTAPAVPSRGAHVGRMWGAVCQGLRRSCRRPSGLMCLWMRQL